MSDTNQFVVFHDDFIGKPPGSITKYGISFVFIFLLILLFFSWIIDYSDSIYARVKINSINPTITINSEIIGVIQSILVENGQYVKQGDNVLLINSDTDLDTVVQLKNIFSQDVLLFDFRSDISYKSMGALRFEYDKLVNNINKYQSLQDDSLVSLKIRQLALENKAMTQQLSNLEKQRSLLLVKNNISEKEYKRTLELNRKKLLSYKDLDSSKSKFIDSQISSNQIQIQINELTSKLVLNQNKIELYSLENKTSLSDLQKKIESQKQLFIDKISTWEKSHVFTANISGVVSIPNNIFNFQNIVQNQELFSIIPDSNKLIGKIKIPENGVGKIEIGQKVTIKLDSYPFHEFGNLNGKILNKSSSVHDSSIFIDVQIEQGTNINNRLITSYGKLISYIPNMQGQVEIITQKKNILSRIFESLYSLL